MEYRGLRKDGYLRLKYASGGNFKQHLSTLTGPAKSGDIYRWAIQAAESLVFCHSNSVLHGDICCANFFLDENQNLKLGDFAGSSVDDSPALVCYHTSHQLPESDALLSDEGTTITVDTEIFAFGSFLYEMITRVQPHNSFTDGEIEERFRRKDFPDVKHLKALGLVIMRCWNLEFATMAEILASIENESTYRRRLGPLFTPLSNL